MKNSMKLIAVSLSILAIGGGLLYNNNKEVTTSKQIINTQGTSEMLKEELATKGKIDKIKVSEEGAIITVGDVKISVHASTNTFKGEALLEVSDLKEGQSVEVYSDGVQSDVLNGLRVEILK